MKKRSVISIGLALMCTSALLPAFPANDKEVVAETGNGGYEYVTPTEFKIINGYNYNVSKPFVNSPDSFEAWIKLPEASLGGVIMGNWHNHDGLFNTVNWEVNALGHFSFVWDDRSISHTFDESPSLLDNTWHHVALVRTENAFTYYLDGVVEGVFETFSMPAVSTASMNIGVDKSSFTDTKSPFDGEIRQVTVYTDAISQEQIVADMQNQAVDEGDTVCDATLMANWYLGEEWTNVLVENSLESGPFVEIKTYDKYVGADYSFGEYDYTFVLVPDIQAMTHYEIPRLHNMMQWLVDQKDELKIEFAVFLGDLADTGASETEYVTAAAAMDRLNNVVPYCFIPGNHDYNDNFKTRDTTLFNKHFPYSKHSALPGFGDVYEEGKMENSYYLFNDCGESGTDYVVINLEHRPRTKVLRWANRILEQYPNHRAIIASHQMVLPDGSFCQNVSASFEVNSSQTIFDNLISKHDNVFLAAGGHHPYDDIVCRTDVGVNGNKITSMLVDGQGTKYRSDPEQDMLLLVHVNEEKKTMNCVYYSPEKEAVWNIQNQFQISIADEFNPTIGK